MRFRLSMLLFLVYAPLGAMWPTFPRHLDTLAFSPLEIALVCATSALAAIIGPLVAGQVADRWLAPERCLAFCGFAAGGVLLLLPSCTTMPGVFLGSLGVWLLMTPAMMLGSSISFAHLPMPERDFGRVRMWGTVGWVVQAWVVGYALGRPEWLHQILLAFRPDAPQPVLADSFHVAAALEFLLGLYALTIPATPPRLASREWLAPLKALRLLQKRHFAIFFLCNFLLCFTVPFAIQNTPLLLMKLEVGEQWTGPALTAAQSTEILTLALLPWLLWRLGLRMVLVIGAAAWAASLTVQMVGSPVFLVIACLSLNGLFITCFVVAGQLCVNSEAGSDIRSSAQALISFSNGIGQVLGYLVSGVVRYRTNGEFRPTFAVAMVLAWLAVAILVVYWDQEN
jgi:MFS family permease